MLIWLKLIKIQLFLCTKSKNWFYVFCFFPFIVAYVCLPVYQTFVFGYHCFRKKNLVFIFIRFTIARTNFCSLFFVSLSCNCFGVEQKTGICFNRGLFQLRCVSMLTTTIGTSLGIFQLFFPLKITEQKFKLNDCILTKYPSYRLSVYVCLNVTFSILLSDFFLL